MKETFLKSHYEAITITNTNYYYYFIITSKTNEKLYKSRYTFEQVIIEGGQYYAEAMMNGTPLAAGKELWLGYAWTLFSINDEARNLQQNLRQCRLSTEVLDYFPVYGR